MPRRVFTSRDLITVDPGRLYTAAIVAREPNVVARFHLQRHIRVGSGPNYHDRVAAIKAHDRVLDWNDVIIKQWARGVGGYRGLAAGMVRFSGDPRADGLPVEIWR
ncbi:hypothetical protein SSBR45G_29980 [Bradyrhizobium sp. SSBR45G]|nr:hypothetical protein SSBR45G_29980 [Bradyrhizobium sp. SSBR45G]GLH87988.1 hypothetical protein SSBR45R_54480 [Bradyrhizobium sp. SSBR45R]